LNGDGLDAFSEWSRVRTKESPFRGNSDDGIAVADDAILQFDKCIVFGNENDGVAATKGAVVSLTGCTLADSLEKRGLLAEDKGTQAVCNECTVRGKYRHGLCASDLASVQLDGCTIVGNEDDNCAGMRWSCCWSHQMPGG
jgi:hypothetical protein